MTSNPSATIGANVRAEMARAGVTQTELATVVGIAQSSLSKRIIGRQDWTVTELIAVAGRLGVPLTDLLRGTEQAAA